MSSKSELTHIEIEGHQVPVKIYREWRRSIRYSIGKTAVHLRLPTLLTQSQCRDQVAALRRWTIGEFARRPDLKQRFIRPMFEDGDRLQVGDRSYRLRIGFFDRSTHAAKLREGEIELRLSQAETNRHELAKAVRHLLSRVVAQDFHPEITARVHQLNQQHFRQPVEGVQLKYNVTNWGSCSAKRNINLSTRLLFAPPKVIDYVIIHELAHLVEMNHSRRFWDLVAAAMPDYEEQEKWLKKFGHRCDF